MTQAHATSIPRILHQTWRSRALPRTLQRCRDSWLSRHPAWEHRFYDDEGCRALVHECGRRWVEVYDSLPTAIQRADLFRYLVMESHGGVYADLDMACYRPIDALIGGASCVLSIEAHLTKTRQRELGYRAPRQLANCVLAAAPGHPFFRALLSRIGSLDRVVVTTDADVEDSTGPRLLTRAFERLDASDRAAIRVLPQILLMAPRECPRLPWIGPPVYARHLAVGSWKRTRRRASLRRWWIERNCLPPLWPAVPARETRA
jgi:mannosyltransferase OCH1-like enzyme